MGLPITAALALVAAVGTGPHLTVRGSTAAVAADRAVGDVLVIDGALELSGVVRGFLFAVSSTVVLHGSAVVLSPMALHGGRLIVEPGAQLPASITLAGTVVQGELPADATVDRTRAPSRAARRAMARYLAFDRPVPAPGVGFDAVAAWTPGADYDLQQSLDDPRELVVGGVARLTFTSDKVRAVAQRSFRSRTQDTVLFTAVELADEATSRAFWAALAAVPERAVSSSVRSALGDGAHWWFVRQGRGCLLWRRDRWFFALETTAPASADTTAPSTDPLAFTDRARIALSESFSVSLDDAGPEGPRP